MGKLKFCLYYFGCGCLGNILHILISKESSISNIGALGLFALSLKIEYQSFKSDDYIEYENYNQSAGLYLYKFVLFSIVVYSLINGGLFISFYMYVGGLLFVVLTGVGDFKVSVSAVAALAMLATK